MSKQPTKLNFRFNLRSRIRIGSKFFYANPTGEKPKPGWVAWSNDGSKKLATAATIEEARKAASKLGEEDPVFEPEQNRFRQA